MLPRKSALLAVAVAASCGAFFCGAGAEAAPPLRNIITPHRAVYDIALVRAEQGSGVSSADGKMVFEVTGSACDGYRMRQRMVVNIADEEGNVGLLDFRITTFETGDGDVYSFDSRTTVNHEVVEAVEGEARRRGRTIEVSLKQPSEKTLTFSGEILFPSQHLQAVIDAALAKQHFLAVHLYEGAGTGDETDEAATAIGTDLAPTKGQPLRSGVRGWPVSIGYFGGRKKSETDEILGEEIPSYQMSFKLYENGVTSDLVMDYGDYALSGSLKTIEALARPSCAGH